MALERLQKIIARAGIASRRKAEELILSGRVTVNGTVASELGTKADPATDEIRANGKPIHAPRKGSILLSTSRAAASRRCQTRKGGRR